MARERELLKHMARVQRTLRRLVARSREFGPLRKLLREEQIQLAVYVIPLAGGRAARTEPTFTLTESDHLFLKSASRHSAWLALRAPGGRFPGATTTAYQCQRYAEEERRRRRPPAAATRRAGPRGVAPRRCSSSLYRSLLIQRPPRAWRDLPLGPARATGNVGTHSKQAGITFREESA